MKMMWRLDVDWSLITTVALIMAIVGAFIILVSMGVKFVAEAFSYNKTEEFEKETRILNACINLNLQIPECDSIYGSIPK
jgi:putative Mn2+ efflux pump MntP